MAPKKKFYRRRSSAYRKAKKRSNYKRKTYASKNAIGKSPKTLIPPTMDCVLAYRDYKYVNSIAQGYYGAVVAGNDCYDPVSSILTWNRQPQGWDQLQTFYQSYSVKASKIYVTVNPTTANSTGILIFTLRPTISNNNDATVTFVNDPESVMNQTRCKHALVTEATAPGSIRTLKAYATYKSMYPDVADTSNVQACTGSPTNKWFWNIGLTRWDHSSGSDLNANISVYVKYYVRFSNPIPNMSQS